MMDISPNHADLKPSSALLLSYCVFLLFVCVFIPVNSHSEPKTRVISGRVIDAVTKEPLVGATVWLKETAIGRTTDANGFFSLTFTGSTGIIEASYLGYEKIELPITDRDNINFQLKSSSGNIDEVVVVG